jgi:hypothetical protein
MLGILLRSLSICSGKLKKLNDAYGTPKMENYNFNFSPQVAYPVSIEALWCKNHENPRDRKSQTEAPKTKIGNFDRIF